MYLEEILENKRNEVAAAKRAKPLALMRREAEALAPAASVFINRPFYLIAEVKQKSPSKGEIRRADGFDPVRIARQYEASGAAALSVLTDKFFGGTLKHFAAVRAATKPPLLRKDFIIDPYQVYQTKLMGADIVLLIVKAVGASLADFITLSRQLGLVVLIEVHDRAELDHVLALTPPSPDIIIGINNRNLDNFVTDLNVSLNLFKAIPPGYQVISESGIRTAADLAALRSLGFHGVLIGEYLVKNPELIKFFSYEKGQR